MTLGPLFEVVGGIIVALLALVIIFTSMYVAGKFIIDLLEGDIF